jgi:hypothetical protein
MRVNRLISCNTVLLKQLTVAQLVQNLEDASLCYQGPAIGLSSQPHECRLLVPLELILLPVCHPSTADSALEPVTRKRLCKHVPSETNTKAKAKLN